MIYFKPEWDAAIKTDSRKLQNGYKIPICLIKTSKVLPSHSRLFWFEYNVIRLKLWLKLLILTDWLKFTCSSLELKHREVAFTVDLSLLSIRFLFSFLLDLCFHLNVFSLVLLMWFMLWFFLSLLLKEGQHIWNSQNLPHCLWIMLPRILKFREILVKFLSFWK